jgi:hypothetical protein
MMNRLREADCPQTAFVEARGDLCPGGFACAKTPPQMPLNRGHKSRWSANGGL